MNPSVPENNTQAPAIQGALSGNPVPAGGSVVPPQPPPPAKPGILGIWANPEKCDTSAWNIYYYYYRQIAQHSPSCKLKYLKWIALAVNVIFFGFPLLDSVGNSKSYIQSFHNINEAFFYMLVVLLTFVPVVMLGNAFKLRVRNVGFMTSRAKAQPPLLHLTEYTSCDGLIGGVVQSLIYTYSLLLLYLLPAFIVFFAIEGSFYEVSISELIAIPFSMLILVFLTMQTFCFRLDTLLLAFLFVVEMGCDFKLFYSIFSILFSTSAAQHYIGRSPWFLLLSWAVAMVYFPLAAADTLEYGVGKNSARIRLLQLGIILFNLALLVIHSITLEQTSEKNSFFAVQTILPALWIMVGFTGLLCSSLSAASFRAKARFIMRTVTEEKHIPRFLNPASPCSTLPICILEIAVVALFIGLPWSRNPSATFWSNSLLSEFGRRADSDAKYMLMAALMVFSAFHFALAMMYHFRRKAPTDKQPWKAYAGFNGLFFVLMIAFLLLAVFFANFRVNGQYLNVSIFLPMSYYPVSILCLIMSALKESSEIRAAKRLAAENNFGASQDTLEAAQ